MSDGSHRSDGPHRAGRSNERGSGDSCEAGRGRSAPTGPGELEAEVAELCGLINAAHAELVDRIARVIEGGSWVGTGIRSVAHWVTLHCGVSAARARQLVTVAEGLLDRPSTRGRLAEGRLSVDQVTPICRHVPPAFEESVSKVAEFATVGQVARMCTRYSFPAGDDEKEDEGARSEQPSAPAPELGHRRRVGFHTDGDWFRAGVCLPATEGAEVEKALVAARDRLVDAGHTDVTWADALIEMSRGYLGGESVPFADRHQVVLHVPAADLDRVRLHLGGLLPTRVAEQILCDTTIRALVDADGRPVGLSTKAHTVPHWLRTVVEDRDGACRVPGCERSRWLQIHHVVPRADDGPTTPDNLVALCNTHHTALHAGELHIAGTATDLQVTGPHGLPIGLAPPTPVHDRPREAAGAMGITSGRQRPTGHRLDTHWLQFNPRAPDPP